MAFILYIYACIGIELITKEKDGYDEQAQHLIDYHFGSLGRFMISLIQFSTFDSAAAIYSHIVFQNWYILPYFVTFMLIVGIALMNLLTAVVVEGSIEQSRNDKDVQQMMKAEIMKKFLPRLLKLFKELDADGSGDISIEEIRKAPRHVKQEMHKLLGDDQIEDIFKIIDFDGSGEIGIDEFFDSITKIVIGTLSVNDLRVQKQIAVTANGLHEHIEELEKKVADRPGW